jgi:hypothetical protein
VVEGVEHPDFQLTPVQDRGHVTPGADEAGQRTGAVECYLIGQGIPPGVLKALDEVQRLEQRLGLRR